MIEEEMRRSRKGKLRAEMLKGVEEFWRLKAEQSRLVGSEDFGWWSLLEVG
jgi:hypothetical protein